MRKFLTIFLLVCFFLNGLCPLTVRAGEFRLPDPGVMVRLSPPFDLPILKGIKVHSDNPFQFDFVLDKGNSELSNDQLKGESNTLIKYFLAGLTIPEKDQWVNLSPYEKDRIIPNSFGMTVMGRDLLAEDYMLKQITASLIYPEDSIGKKFWKRIYEEAAKKYGTTNIPVNTFNKVWIVPQKAVVFENEKEGTAYVVESKLKVMLEQDYLSMSKHQRQPGDMSRFPGTCPQAGCQTSESLKVKASQGNPNTSNTDINALGSQVVREIVIPELSREVNTGKNFSKLRQVFNSLILATWYKEKIKDSILAQVYSDKNKVAGVTISDPQEKEKIYQRYLKAFKKGVYSYIKEEQDPLSQEIIPRKYFSGGVMLNMNTDISSSRIIKYVKSLGKSIINKAGLVVVMAGLVGFSQHALSQSTSLTPFVLSQDKGSSFTVVDDSPKPLNEQELHAVLKGVANSDDIITSYQKNDIYKMGTYLSELFTNHNDQVAVQIFSTMKGYPQGLGDEVLDVVLKHPDYPGRKEALKKYFRGMIGIDAQHLVLMLADQDKEIQQMGIVQYRDALGKPDVNLYTTRLHDIFKGSHDKTLKIFLVQTFSNPTGHRMREHSLDTLDLEGVKLGANDSDPLIRHIAWEALGEWLEMGPRYEGGIPENLKQVHVKILNEVMKWPDEPGKFNSLRALRNWVPESAWRGHLSDVTKALRNRSVEIRSAALAAINLGDLGGQPELTQAYKNVFFDQDDLLREKAISFLHQRGLGSFKDIFNLSDIQRIIKAIDNHGEKNGLLDDEAVRLLSAIIGSIDGITGRLNYFDTDIWPKYEKALMTSPRDSTIAAHAGTFIRMHFQVEGRKLEKADIKVLLMFLARGGRDADVATVDSVLENIDPNGIDPDFGFIRAVAQRIQEFGAGQATLDDIKDIYQQQGFIDLTKGLTNNIERLSVAVEVAEVIKGHQGRLTEKNIKMITDFIMRLNSAHDTDPVIQKGGKVIAFIHPNFIKTDEAKIRQLAADAKAEVEIHYGQDISVDDVIRITEEAAPGTTFYYSTHGSKDGSIILDNGKALSSKQIADADAKNKNPETYVIDACYGGMCGAELVKSTQNKENPSLVIESSGNTTAAGQGSAKFFTVGSGGFSVKDVRNDARNMANDSWSGKQAVRIFLPRTPIQKDELRNLIQKLDKERTANLTGRKDHAMQAQGIDLVRQFGSILQERNAMIADFEKTSPVVMAHQKMEALDWNLFEMDKAKGRYLELFVGEDKIVAYGIITLMNGVAMLRFQSFEKSAQKGDYWALVFRQRVETLNRTLFQGRNIKYVAVPTDQVLSEDQLAKRTRHLSDNRGWEQKVNNLLNTVRKGYPLTDAYKQMVQVDAFDGYYTFGPAANFYVNKLGFDFIPSAIAPHKARWSDREKELLGRLKKHERLSDLELIEIFSGRGLIKKVSDFAMNSRLKLGSQSFKVKNVTGGIDLTSAKMNLETQNAGQRIKFHLDPALLAQLKNIPGFIPVVTNIQPLKSLPEFLGLKEASANASF